MFSIRVTKTASKASAVQVVRYENRKVVIVSHIGSAHNEEDLKTLKEAASTWIEKRSKQLDLFPTLKLKESNQFSLDKCRFLGTGYSFIYDCLSQLFDRFGFTKIKDQMLLDLTLIRIIEPASKLRSFELLEELFGIKYAYRGLNRHLPEFIRRKDEVEGMVLGIAQKELGFDFNLVFYDVTTLYFEAFGEDELRKPGFSKDGKSNQPQILIGLVVNKEGFPIAYEVFEGNTFEGKTIVPVIKAFQSRHNVKNLTVVADAGMISLDNITKLKESQMTYIVGARIANLKEKDIKEVSTSLKQQDGATVRIKTNNGTLICGFSDIRYKKDKREMEKQITRAETLLKNPGKMKRAKFIANTKKGGSELEINDSLVKKTESLLGIKGYYTNLDHQDNETIIQQYHNLWHVEHAFRIAKNDLQTRPIYHFKKNTVKAHVLICFMALAVCKYMELKTSKSTKKIIRELKRVTDARILNTVSGEITTMQTAISEEAMGIVDKLGLKR
jgi:transposase